jgi:hypothetical protein
MAFDKTLIRLMVSSISNIPFENYYNFMEHGSLLDEFPVF